MKFFVINSKDRPERLESFLIQFDKHFNRKDLTIVDAIMKQPPLVGISQSHKKCCKLAIQMKLDRYMVFEDDFQWVSDKSFDYLTQALIKAPKADILLFGTYMQKDTQSINEYWNSVKDFCGLHCYVVNQSAYDYILNAPENNHLDRLIGRDKNITKVVTKKLPTKQSNGYSDNTKRVEDYDHLLEQFELI